jgi:hypothetical protein
VDLAGEAVAIGIQGAWVARFGGGRLVDHGSLLQPDL